MLKLSKKEIEQIDRGLEITFLHIEEVLKNPKILETYPETMTFFPVYIKRKDKEALLIGVRPGKAAG